MQKEQRGDEFIPGSNADPSDKNQKKRTWHILQRVIDEQINLLILSCCFLSSCVKFSFSLALILQNYFLLNQRIMSLVTRTWDATWQTDRRGHEIFLQPAHSLNNQSPQEVSVCKLCRNLICVTINISNLHQDTSLTTYAAWLQRCLGHTSWSPSGFLEIRMFK